MKKLLASLLCLIVVQPAFAESTFNSKKIICDVVDHPVYSQTIVHGDSEIHFIRRDGKKNYIHHDGYNFEETKKSLSAIYHDGDDLLFYLNLEDGEGKGFVLIPGWDDANNLNIKTEFYEIKCLVKDL